jgi:hypothetical protein
MSESPVANSFAYAKRANRISVVSVVVACISASNLIHFSLNFLLAGQFLVGTLPLLISLVVGIVVFAVGRKLRRTTLADGGIIPEVKRASVLSAIALTVPVVVVISNVVRVALVVLSYTMH